MGGKADTKDFVTEISGIPLYGQSDTRWGGQRLFNKRNCRTLAAAGCTMTSLAMLNSYYGEEDWTPKRLNDCIAAKGGHVRCDLDMTTVSNECLAPGMKHHYQVWKNLYAEMRIQIIMGSPFLARVARTKSCGPANKGDHTVLVTGWEGTGKRRADFQIYDPKGDGAIRKLSAYPKLCYLQYVTGPLPVVPML